MELDPWVIPQLSKISRDTIETMLIFADAARTDSRYLFISVVLNLYLNVFDLVNDFRELWNDLHFSLVL
jgi:hypothetical protein